MAPPVRSGEIRLTRLVEVRHLAAAAAAAVASHSRRPSCTQSRRELSRRSGSATEERPPGERELPTTRPQRSSACRHKRKATPKKGNQSGQHKWRRPACWYYAQQKVRQRQWRSKTAIFSSQRNMNREATACSRFVLTALAINPVASRGDLSTSPESLRSRLSTVRRRNTLSAYLRQRRVIAHERSDHPASRALREKPVQEHARHHQYGVVTSAPAR